MPAFADVAVLLSDGGGRQSVSESGARENPFFGKNRFFAIDGGRGGGLVWYRREIDGRDPIF